MYTGSMSKPMYLSRRRVQATAVDPLPMKGSRTREIRAEPMEPQAHLRQLVGEHRRVRSGGLDGLVGDEPGVAPFAQIRRRGLPSADVAFILVRDADRVFVQGNVPGFSEVEDVLMAGAEELRAVHRLVVTDRDVLLHVGILTDVCFGDGDGFDPVDDVLQGKIGLAAQRELQRGPLVSGFAADVEEEGTLVGHDGAAGGCDLLHPIEVLLGGRLSLWV